MHILGYLDNLLLREQSILHLDHNVSLMVRSLERLVLNLWKPALVQAHRLEYLELLLDTFQMKVILFLEKSLALGNEAAFLRSLRFPLIRVC